MDPSKAPPPGPPPEADETLVADLLPPDTATVPPTKRIAERRIAGWATCARLLARRGRRPAGNSRRFWARMEEDDPYLPRPPGTRLVEGEPPALPSHDVSAASRLSRNEGGKSERPAPAAAKTPPRPPAPEPKPPPPKPPPPRPPPPKPAAATPMEVDEPEMEHAADPRRVPKPPPRPPPRPAPVELEDDITTMDETARPPAPRPPPPRPPQPAAAKPSASPGSAPPRPSPPQPVKPTVDRTPPRIAQPQGRPGGGRVAAGPTRPEGVQRALVDKTGRGSAEVRKEREEARRGPQFPPRRSLDDYLGIMGDLAASEKLYREGKLLKEQEEEEAARAPTPRPQPKAVAERPAPPRPPPPRPPPPRPQPQVAPRPAARADDDEDDLDLPPSPPSREEPRAPAAPPKPKDGPVNRSPRSAMTAGPTGTGLDDLFGGAQEGRVKIGKRAPPKSPTEEPGG